MKIRGVEFVLECEHPSRRKLGEYLSKVEGMFYVLKTSYGTWRVYRPQ